MVVRRHLHGGTESGLVHFNNNNCKARSTALVLVRADVFQVDGDGKGLCPLYRGRCSNGVPDVHCYGLTLFI